MSTLIVPHDRTWEKAGAGLLAGLLEEDEDEAASGGARMNSGDDGYSVEREAEVREFICQCAAALVACEPGKAAVYCGGDALIADQGALQAAGAVAALTVGLYNLHPVDP